MRPCTNPEHHDPYSVRVAWHRKPDDTLVFVEAHLACKQGERFPCVMVTLRDGDVICDSPHHTHSERSIHAAELNTRGCIALVRAICENTEPEQRQEIADWLAVEFNGRMF